ncbi:ABC transporter ATP-binding protein [Achromobacter animicus]|uniref:ABC transporter ATP-binding protein n=1 Tax=Achromobacter animicus TaxID=1389935 RepID=UPI0014650915|nr:ABC transporter ATP-binding protein [Achromobacter animicus]CAB3886559.1 ATM1-type heavy metal exporter [Achromobacter animicus]
MPDLPALPTHPTAFLWRYVRQRPWAFGLLGLIVVLAGVCSVTVQYAMKLIVDAMALGADASVQVWWALGLFLAVIAIEAALWRCGGWLGCRNIVAACAALRVEVFEHLSHHSTRYFRQHHSGALANRISSTASAAGAIYGAMVWSIVPPCVDFLGAVVVLSMVDWRMAAALLGFVLVLAAIIISFGARGRSLHQQYGEQAAHVGGEIVDAISNIWAVQAFSAQARERARLEKALGEEARAQRRSWMYVEKARVIHDACLWLVAGGMLLWVLRAWEQGQASPGDVVVVSALTFRILHGSRDLALALVGTAQQFGVIAEMLRLVGRPHSVPDVPHAQPLRDPAGAIAFEGVQYTYPDGCHALHGITLSIRPGMKVGLVGASGAGKSTLLSLLQRADEPQQGRILIGGQDIREVTLASLKDAMSVVPQDVSLFRRTIMENIRYGRPDATEEDVITAARQAHCDTFIQRLPDGYATIVGERGALLSGGERQRIGIARAFLKDAPILLLDEATSALDSYSEQLIKDALAELMRSRTVVAVAHRLSSLTRYDRIVVVDAGRIVEDGSLDELLAARGPLRALWDLQAGHDRRSGQDGIHPVPATA